MRKELKQCPFCGSDAELVDKKYSNVQIICSSCGARTPEAYKFKPDSIITHWNNRTNKDSNNDLKPCPFCGSDGKLIKTYKDTFIVQCQSCRNGTAYFYTSDEAKAAWNNRAN